MLCEMVEGCGWSLAQADSRAVEGKETQEGISAQPQLCVGLLKRKGARPPLVVPGPVGRNSSHKLQLERLRMGFGKAEKFPERLSISILRDSQGLAAGSCPEPLGLSPSVGWREAWRPQRGLPTIPAGMPWMLLCQDHDANLTQAPPLLWT